MNIFILSIIALTIGSFISLFTSRLVSKEAIVFTRSKCPNCLFVLKIYNLVPLFSWLMQKGKCTNCKTKISIRYPLIELSFLISFLLIYFTLDQNINIRTIIYFAITACLIVMVVVDLEHYFIPNFSQYLLTIFATLALIINGGTDAVLINLKSGIAYMLFGIAMFLLFYYIAEIEAIGVDDIKFFFIAGFLLGLENFTIFMFMSGIFGVFFGTIWQKIKEDSTFPFAPAICLSTFLCLLFGHHFNLSKIFDSLFF
jgi:prepilin signal peptidase PulO-like enzyme (type II secretory pathway)